MNANTTNKSDEPATRSISLEPFLFIATFLNEIMALMLVITGGTVINTCIGLGAIYAAITRKVRVWVNPRLHAKTNGDLRLIARLRPIQFGFNYAIFIVVTALVFPPLVVATLAVTALTVGQNAGAAMNVWEVIFMFVAFFGGPFAMVPCYSWLSSRIIARTPKECWPETSLPYE